MHFTGSSPIFRSLFREVGERIDRYRSYPRLVGETGGKDFVVMHASADPQAVATALVRGSFEYQGQKCSAASRAYIPDTLWPEVRDRALALVGEIRQGDPTDLDDVHGRRDRRPRVRAPARRVRAREVLGERDASCCGGGCDDSVGWFVEPTIIETSDPHFDTMERELFGPVPDRLPVSRGALRRDPRAVRRHLPVRADRLDLRRRPRRDRARAREAPPRGRQLLRQRQAHRRRSSASSPSAARRASGTNDKAGWSNNLMRWSSPRSRQGDVRAAA